MMAELKERLGTELDRVSQELALAMMPEAVADAARADAVSEAERLAMQKRIRCLGQLVAGLSASGEGDLPADRVGYGSEVEVQDLTTGQRETYLLVTGEVLDLDQNHVTLGSPLGQALLGRRAGERVVVESPRGRRRLRITSIVTLPQMLGLAGRKANRVRV